MSRVFQALTAEPWAIVPAELQKIAAIVQRHATPDAAGGEPEYQKRDYLLMAGPGARRLAGTSRAFLVDGAATQGATRPALQRLFHHGRKENPMPDLVTLRQTSATGFTVGCMVSSCSSRKLYPRVAMMQSDKIGTVTIAPCSTERLAQS